MESFDSAVSVREPTSRSRLYGWNGYVRGHVIATVPISSPYQVMIMQRALQDAMRVYAGRPEEKHFARWFNILETTASQAKLENWRGWETPAGASI